MHQPEAYHAKALLTKAGAKLEDCLQGELGPFGHEQSSGYASAAQHSLHGIRHAQSGHAAATAACQLQTDGHS